MKSAIFASVFLFLGLSAQAGQACDEVQALHEYYYGPEIRDLVVKEISPGLYSVSYYDDSKPAKCTGGQAQVTHQCEVIPVRGLFCDYL